MTFAARSEVGSRAVGQREQADAAEGKADVAERGEQPRREGGRRNSRKGWGIASMGLGGSSEMRLGRGLST